MSAQSGIIPLSIAAVALATHVGIASAADRTPLPSPTQTSTLTPGEESDWKDANLPGILSDADAARYRVIFSLQEDGEWKASNKIIAELKDRTLLGHVLAQRYLHPTKYRSRYKELRNWMAQYADHPHARQIYRLALRRKPKNWRAPRPPKGSYLIGSGHDGRTPRNRTYTPRIRLNRADRQKARTYQRRIRWYIRKGWTKAAKNLIRSTEFKRVTHQVTYDRTRATLGGGYLVAGRTEWALQWAGAAAKRSGQYLPLAHWTAGLAAWRLAKYHDAAHHFERVAISEYSSPWLISGGGFWAARAYLRGGKPERVNHWLGVASAYSRTFYGLLARRSLGLEVTFNWAPPPLAEDAIAELSAHPGGRRAVDLLQVGQDHRAERELRMLFHRASPELARAMLALADRTDMPSLAMRLSNLLVQSGSSLYDSTAYPVPTLALKDTTVKDKALVLALIRQESGFNPRAMSRAGARGLMQLMPRTASFVARDRRYRRDKRRALFDPETNISLGQKYIEILLKDERIKGDILQMAAAWNAGPGNLGRWQRKLDFSDDPLLFIETIPLRETRIFVERVLTNLWIYRARFDQPTPTLDALARGEWPVYRPLGGSVIEVAVNERQSG